MSGTAGSRRVETNETARATATAAIKTRVAVKSPAFGPLRIAGGRKGATAGAKSFGRALAKKNRISGPVSTPNLSHGDWSFPRFAFGTAAPTCISFIPFGLSRFFGARQCAHAFRRTLAHDPAQRLSAVQLAFGRRFRFNSPQPQRRLSFIPLSSATQNIS